MSDSDLEGSVEILDRDAGCWISFSSFEKEATRRPSALLAEYSYGYQERFAVVDETRKTILEPFYSAIFILGCVESGPSLLGASAFLTGGDEEEFWLIESDGKEVSLFLVTDNVTQDSLMEAIGGGLGFQRIESGLLRLVPATVRTLLLRIGAARWKGLVESWAKQYISLLDVLLEVKDGNESQALLRDRERLLRAG